MYLFLFFPGFPSFITDNAVASPRPVRDSVLETSDDDGGVVAARYHPSPSTARRVYYAGGEGAAEGATDCCAAAIINTRTGDFPRVI